MKYIVLIGIVFLISCSTKPKPDGKLEGVVTYFFNNNFGDKPDVGAKIQVCRIDKIRKGVIDSLHLFMRAKFFISQIRFNEEMIKSYERMGSKEYQEYIQNFKTEIDKYQAQLKEEGKMSVEDFDKLKNQLSLLTVEFAINRTQEVVADGSGRYQVSLPPGGYYILAQSNHRRNYGTGEILGVLDLDDVSIESNATQSINFNFTLSDSD